MMQRILEGKTIFLVEDDIVNVSVYATSLKTSGALVVQDVFGYGIVEHIVQSLPVDLIILDIMLRGGKSGYDVYDELRAHPQLKDIPVIAVTSLDPETEIPRAQAKGMNGFISKPIKAWEFPQLILKVLNGEKVWVISR